VIVRVPLYLDKVHRALAAHPGRDSMDRAEYRVVFCGSRELDGDRRDSHEMRTIWAPVTRSVVYLVVARRRPRIVRLAQGGARGIDRWAAHYGRRAGASVPSAYLPDWDLGRQAGPIRNEFMLSTEAPDLVIGIQTRRHSPGTIDCLKQAQALGLPWVKITEEDLRVWVDAQTVPARV
jgi:hypothetical protein